MRHRITPESKDGKNEDFGHTRETFGRQIEDIDEKLKTWVRKFEDVVDTTKTWLLTNRRLG